MWGQWPVSGASLQSDWQRNDDLWGGQSIGPDKLTDCHKWIVDVAFLSVPCYRVKLRIHLNAPNFRMKSDCTLKIWEKWEIDSLDKSDVHCLSHQYPHKPKPGQLNRYRQTQIWKEKQTQTQKFNFKHSHKIQKN